MNPAEATKHVDLSYGNEGRVGLLVDEQTLTLLMDAVKIVTMAYPHLSTFANLYKKLFVAFGPVEENQ